MAHAVEAKRASAIRGHDEDRGKANPAVGTLRVSLFGRLQIVHEGIASTTAPTRAVQNLLAYLLLHRHRTHSRESLLGIFWGDHDEESARNCLNTTLWRIRRVLEPPGVRRGSYVITTAGGEVGFNAQSPHWLDVEVLERCAGAVVEAADANIRDGEVKQLEEALRLYAGDVLEGVYDDWALRERERLRSIYLNSLACLVRYHRAHGARRRSIACAEELLRHDPLREDVHRTLIRLHIESGARALAARQYDICRRALANELGVDPMPETQALVSLFTGSPLGVSEATGAANGLAAELRSAAHGVERALDHLRGVLGRVEAALNGASRK